MGVRARGRAAPRGYKGWWLGWGIAESGADAGGLGWVWMAVSVSVPSRRGDATQTLWLAVAALAFRSLR